MHIHEHRDRLGELQLEREKERDQSVASLTLEIARLTEWVVFYWNVGRTSWRDAKELSKTIGYSSNLYLAAIESQCMF